MSEKVATGRFYKLINHYDSKAEAWGDKLMFFESTGVAMRAIQMSVNKPGTGFYESPGDFTFFEVGTYDSTTGDVEMYDARRNLGTALEFKKEEATIN